MATTIITPVERDHGIAMHAPGTDKYWHFATRAGFALPLVDRGDGVDPMERFQGVMARRCPPPCMMGVLNKIFSSASRLLKPEDHELPETQLTRLHVLLGDPGIGKTDLAYVLSDAMGWDAFVVPPGVGGGNLDELIRETRLGSRSAESIIESVNRELIDAPEKSPLVQLLKEKDLLEEDTNEAGRTRRQIKFNALSGGDAISKLKEITSIAMPQLTGSSATVSYAPGRLLKKLIETKETGVPTVILVDEINRYKNMGALMQNLYEMLSGTRGKCTLSSVDENGRPRDYTFTREDLANVMMIGTGNIPDARKEPEAKQLSDSLESRIGVKPIEMRFGPADYAHRLCQEQLGLALTTYYAAGRDKYNALPPEETAGHFSSLLTKGKTPAEMKQKAHLGTQQLLRQAGEFQEAASLLGNVYYGLQELCADRVQNLRTELRTLKSPPPFGPRQVQNPLAQWTFCLPDNPDIQFDEPPSQYNLGTRTVNALRYWVDENFPKNKGFDATRAYIGQLLLDNRIISVSEYNSNFTQKVTELPDNVPTGRSVAELINVGSHVKRDEELTAAQALLFEMAKRQFPDECGEAKLPDQLFTKQAVGEWLDEYRAQLAADKAAGAAPDAAGQAEATFSSKFAPTLQRAGGKFSLQAAKSGAQMGAEGFAGKLSRSSLEGQLLAVIANDKDSDLSQLFTTRPFDDAIEKEIAGKAAHLRAAERAKLQSISDGTHPAGIHMTTLALDTGGNMPAGFTLLRNVPPAKDGEAPPPAQYIMVGDSTLPPSVTGYLKKLNMHYINRSTSAGAEELQAQISALISTGAERVIQALAARENKPSDEIADALKQTALKAYNDAWNEMFLGGNSTRLLTMNLRDQEIMEGKPMLHETSQQIQGASTADEKKRIIRETGAGLVEEAKNAVWGEEPHKSYIAQLQTKVAFAVQHGQVNEQNVAVPLIEPNAVAANVTR